MKFSSLFIATLVMAAAATFAQSTQGTAAAESSSSASANRSGANVSNASSWQAAAMSKHATANAAGDSEINATLTKPVDARKAKPGDPVTAKADRDAKASDGSMIKRGSTLMGHVTQAQPKSSASGGADSTLGIVFDKAVTRDGHEVPLNSSIQAIGMAQSESEIMPDSIGTTTGGSGAAVGRGAGALGGVAGSATAAVGGLGRGVTGPVGATVAAAGSLATHSPGAIGGLTGGGALQSGSQGVFGLEGLSLSNGSSGGAQGSVIRSTTHNVRLDGGTKMLLSNNVGTPGTATTSVTGAANSAAATSSSAPGTSGSAARGQSADKNQR